MPTFSPPAAAHGVGGAPAIVPCAPGSRRVSPWSGVVQSYSDWVEDGAANGQRFIVWTDNTQNFRAWGNGDPVTYVDEDGVSVLAHLGRWNRTRFPGPTGPIWNNPLALLWNETEYPVGEAFSNLTSKQREDDVGPTSTSGGERRSYLSPHLWYLLRNPDPLAQNQAWDYLREWNEIHHSRRPFYHLGKNGLQAGGPHPFVSPQVGGYDINRNQKDEANRSRTWNWSASWSFSGPGGNYNAWDKGHNWTVYQWAAAAAGHGIGYVNLWLAFAGYWQNFRPGHDPANGNGFDQPRSAIWQCLLAVFGGLAGFDYADPDMVRDFCGGLAGQNGGLGWRPRDTMDWIARRILGSANGGTYGVIEELVYWSNDADDNVLVVLCPNCTTTGTENGPGVSGCERVDKSCSGTPGHYNTEKWIDSAGVNHGDQIIGVDIWQGAMCFYGLALLLKYHDFQVALYGPSAGPLTADTYTKARTFLTEMTDEIEARAMNADGATGFYCGVASRSASSRDPKGYSFTTATEMWNNIDFRNPSKKKSDYEVREIADRPGEFVVAQKVKAFGDEFYSLLAPMMALARGPFATRTNQLLDDWLPPPGSDPGDSNPADFSRHMDYVLSVYRAREIASGIYTTTPPAGRGLAFGVPLVDVGQGDFEPPAIAHGGEFEVPTVQVGTSVQLRAVPLRLAPLLEVPEFSTGNALVLTPPAAEYGLRGSGVPRIGELELYPPDADYGSALGVPRVVVAALVNYGAPVARHAHEWDSVTVRTDANLLPPDPRHGLGFGPVLVVTSGGVSLPAEPARWAPAFDPPQFSTRRDFKPPAAAFGQLWQLPVFSTGGGTLFAAPLALGSSCARGDVLAGFPADVVALCQPNGPRLAILEAIRARLDRVTECGTRVYLEKPEALQAAGVPQLPALCVWCDDEDADEAAAADLEYRRTMRVAVAITAARDVFRAGSGRAGRRLRHHESEQRDELAQLVEGLLLEEPTLGGIAAEIDYVGTEFDTAIAEQAVAACSVRFDVTYYTDHVERAIREAVDLAALFTTHQLAAPEGVPTASGDTVPSGS